MNIPEGCVRQGLHAAFFLVPAARRLPFAAGNVILTQDGSSIIFRQTKEIFACESDWLNFC